MKKIFLTTVTILFTAIGISAATKEATISNEQPFVFVESGIEIALFKDGQFDFNVISPTTSSNVGVNINTGFLNFSFNSGHNYDTYVQYDDYGAVVQIENTTIDYDYYGRVYRIGNVHMDYNYNGLVNRIGNMHIGYNHYGNVAYANGIINNYNVNYATYNPYCRVYRRPLATRVIVHNTPYRRNYTPVRYNYVTYRKNYRRNNHSRVVNYKRPGKVIVGNRQRYNNKPLARKTVNNRPAKVANKRVVKNTQRVNNSRKHTPRTVNNNNTRNNNSRKYTPRTTSNSNRATANTRVNNKATNTRTQNKQYKSVKTNTNRSTSTVATNNTDKSYRRR